RASLASQAVGPPLSDVEMSAAGRSWLKLGKKMLSLRPLAQQAVHPEDSVLGPLVSYDGEGLATTYADMIRAAFRDEWWNSDAIVDANLDAVSGADAAATDRFTMMEANFSMFWGLAVLSYESTLISDDAPYDRFAAGDAGALTQEQKMGLQMFMGATTGNCIACHAGAEFTGASFSARLDPLGREGVIERMVMGDGNAAVYD